MIGISALEKETSGCSLIPPCMWGHRKETAISRGLTLTRHQNHEKLISVVYKPPSLWYFFFSWYFCYSSLIRPRHMFLYFGGDV